MGRKVRMADVIILLPGITGSVLQKGGVDLWSLSIRAIFRSIKNLGSELERLALDVDDIEDDEPRDGIEATGLIQSACLVPGFIKVDGYTKISEMIFDRFDVVKGRVDKEYNDTAPAANYFEFPYDWRRDNRVAARRLKSLVDLSLRRWRKETNPRAKVILLAHSMGGLVARYYLELLGGKEDCKALITFGTPHRGSPKALNFLANGYKKLFVDMTTAMRSFSSLYQLLPIYKMVKANGAYHRVADLDNIPNVERTRAQAGLNFHREIIEQARNDRGGYYANIPVVGTYQPTLQSAELSENVLTTGEVLPEGVDKLVGHGDGTVPYLSAIPPELSDSYRNVFYAECHGSLQSNDQVLNFIYEQLYNTQVEGLGAVLGPERSLYRGERAAISLSLQDLYFSGEPIRISACVREGGTDLEDIGKFQDLSGSLVANIKSVEASKPATTAVFHLRHDEWVIDCEGLEPGLYRIEVKAVKTGPFAPPPVHDLFQVAE
jgi:hypothetical protein